MYCESGVNIPRRKASLERKEAVLDWTEDAIANNTRSMYRRESMVDDDGFNWGMFVEWETTGVMIIILWAAPCDASRTWMFAAVESARKCLLFRRCGIMILVPLIPYWLGEMLHQCHQEICQQGTRNTAICEASFCRLEIFVGEFLWRISWTWRINSPSFSSTYSKKTYKDNKCVCWGELKNRCLLSKTIWQVAPTYPPVKLGSM